MIFSVNYRFRLNTLRNDVVQKAPKSINSKEFVWSCDSLLASLRRSSNSKELGLMTSLRKLRWMNKRKREKQMEMAQHESIVLSVLNMVDSKRLRLIVTIVQWTLPFCIVRCFVQLIFLARSLKMTFYLILMMTEGDENLHVRRDRCY